MFAHVASAVSAMVQILRITCSFIAERICRIFDSRLVDALDFSTIDLKRSILDVIAVEKPVSSLQEGCLAEKSMISLGEELLAMIFLFFFPGIMVWGFPLLFWTIYYAYNNPTHWLSAFFFLMWTYLIWYPFQFDWRGVIRTNVVKVLYKYFSFKIVCEGELDPSKEKYIFAAPPHGAFPFGNLLAVLFFDLFAGYRFYPLAASILFRSPLVRTIFLWIGAIDASREAAEKALNEGKSIGISSGGIAEVFETNEDQETIVLNDRKGFIRLAMVTGAKIIPCYVFGNTSCLKVISDNSRILARVSRWFRFTFSCFYGRWYSPIPVRAPLVCVLGKPISVPHTKNPTREEINKYHKLFIQEIVDLFEVYKTAYGWKDKQLVIK